MNKDGSDFMLEEYDKIASAYFGLRDQINEWFKAYLALLGLPLTVLAAVLKLGDGQGPISLSQLPDVVAGLLVTVAVLGFFVALNIIAMRMEMILYARTINGVRRYFADLHQQPNASDNSPKLAQFLILPTSDAVPPFYEAWRAMFWQVVIVGALDGLVFAVAMQSLTGLGWALSAAIGLIYAAAHLGAYVWMAHRRHREWRVRFPSSLNAAQH
jgi:hypothetical protein